MKLKHFKPKHSKKRGQLHIAETLVASTILLVLALSVANITVTLSEEPEGLKWLEERAWAIMETADSSGLLKPAVYLEDETSLGLLEDFITSKLPINFGFSLNRVSNGQKKVLISAGSLEANTAETYVASYFISGYSSLEHGIFEISYTVTLALYKVV
ncbi:MAG: hypothetical protein ACFFD4_25995 [Candidatus Odinarchaeota archaeon]